AVETGAEESGRLVGGTRPSPLREFVRQERGSGTGAKPRRPASTDLCRASARQEPVSYPLGRRRSELATGARDHDVAAASQCRNARPSSGRALAASGSARPYFRARERLSQVLNRFEE